MPTVADFPRAPAGSPMAYYADERSYLVAYGHGEIRLLATRGADGSLDVELPPWPPALRVLAIHTTTRPDWRGGPLPFRSTVWLAAPDGSVWYAVVGRNVGARFRRVKDPRARGTKNLMRTAEIVLD